MQLGLVTQMAAQYSPKLAHNTEAARTQGPPPCFRPDTRSTGRSAEQRRRRHGGAKPPAACGVRGGVRPPLPRPRSLRRPCWFWKPEHRRRRSGLSIPLQTPAALLPVLTRIKQALPASPAAVLHRRSHLLLVLILSHLLPAPPQNQECFQGLRGIGTPDPPHSVGSIHFPISPFFFVD